jgi:ATP-dependent RNA helicase SUPV3L1/SUV3
MLAHGTGMIGLPLRLLAREIYDRMVRVKGERACALITGEERIRPPNARYFACTVEAMPVSEGADFVAIDEVQLAGDPDRGHVFTSRILHARGGHETLLLGSDTIRPVLRALDLAIDSERRERFSQLRYSGPTKITKLPKRTAIVAFSAEEVYAIAELLKRQRGGCAVIMGALSPRTRNSQVALYQSGEVDYVVATDAIGMGLNLDISHVAFASRRKFDGRHRRLLRADELAQIAGRAGRFRDDGTFGETADCEPFDEETVERICEHHFEPMAHLNWRSVDLDFHDLDSLQHSLRRPSPHKALRRAPEALDEATLIQMAVLPDVRRRMRGHAHVRRLWDLCTLPDFRKAGLDGHLRLVSMLAEQLMSPDARLKDEWVYSHIERLDCSEGDIDALQHRLSEIRTWTYAANRSDWMENAETWRLRTREIEDRLSDALHEALMQRFVDRRTSTLMRSLSADEYAPAEIAPTGEVQIEGHVVGRLEGLKFRPDSNARTLEGRAVRNAAIKSLRPVIEQRLLAIAGAPPEAFSFDASNAAILFDGAVIARLVRGADWLRPDVELVGAEDALAPLRDKTLAAVTAWVRADLESLLGPLLGLDRRGALEGASPVARGLAFEIRETGASIDRRRAPPNAAKLEPDDRQVLRRLGLHVGRVAAWAPDLLKPARLTRIAMLRAVFSGRPYVDPPGAVSFVLSGATFSDLDLASLGYLRLGPRAVRADMAERLSVLLSDARRTSTSSRFEVAPALAAIIGCPLRDFPAILRALGLIPAQRDPEGTVSHWRFAGARTAAETVRMAPANPHSPFAELASLSAPTANATPKRRRRKRPAAPTGTRVSKPVPEAKPVPEG